MKWLEELGISPAPWRYGKFVGRVNDRDGNEIVSSSLPIMQTTHIVANTRLCRASPGLYKALYEAVEEKCYGCSCLDSAGKCYCERCKSYSWRAALAEAAGEVAK